MPTIIKPTVGRVVWYYPGGKQEMEAGQQPLSAQIAYVHSDICINIGFLSQNGMANNATSVRLFQAGETPHDYAFCMWMPYQQGQAAKAEALETKFALAPSVSSHALDRIARVAHEVNRAYCQALGDLSQPAWEEAPPWQRESARMGVDLHLMGDFGPEASHIAWMQQKLDDGWKYGPVKNPDAKEHPCIVPFAELPREQQAKDYIFRAVVHALKPGI